VESVPLRKNVHSSVMDQVQQVELKELKHVETLDKGKPNVDVGENWKAKKTKLPKVLDEIKDFKGFAEKKAEYEKNAQEQVQVREKVFLGIVNEQHELHHVETHDTSSPRIDDNIKVRKNVHSQVFQQIQEVQEKELKHVDTVDKTKPVIDKNVHVKKNVHPLIFQEIKAGPELSAKKSQYEKSVEESKKLDENFKNREGTDIAELTGVATNKKQLYEQQLEEAKKLEIKNKEGGDTADLSGVAKRIKEQYQKEVQERNPTPEGIQKEKDGDKVVYKNLPPKKDLNELI